MERNVQTGSVLQVLMSELLQFISSRHRCRHLEIGFIEELVQLHRVLDFPFVVAPQNRLRMNGTRELEAQSWLAKPSCS